LAESQPSKLLVAGSIPVARSILLRPGSAAKGAGIPELRRMPSEASSGSGFVWRRSSEGGSHGHDGDAPGSCTREMQISQSSVRDTFDSGAGGREGVSPSGIARAEEGAFLRAAVSGRRTEAAGAVTVSRGRIRMPGRFRRGSGRTVDKDAHVAQSVEHVLGKDGVGSSILLVGSNMPDTILSRGEPHGQAEV
jgi:hypothetical protein